MADVDLSSLQAMLSQSPAVQQALQAWQTHGLDAASGRGHGVSPNEMQAQNAARAAGMPEGYYLGPDGVVKQNNGLDSTFKAWALLGGAAAPFAVPGLLGGGGAAATTGGGGSGSYIGADVAHTAGAALGGGSALAGLHGLGGLAASLAIPAAIRGLTGGFGGGSGSGGSGGGTPPELSALLADAMKRMQSQQPLFDSVTRQAQAGLPTYAQKGGG